MRWGRREQGLACRCAPDGHELRTRGVVLRTVTDGDVPALLDAVDDEIVAANGWPDDPAWIEQHVQGLARRRVARHDFIEHLLVVVERDGDGSGSDTPRGEVAGVRSVYRHAHRLVTHGWMRAASMRAHRAELDAVTRFAHFHLGFPVVFVVAQRDDDVDRKLLRSAGYSGPHPVARAVPMASGVQSQVDVYVHRERGARHRCTTLPGPDTPSDRPATVPSDTYPPTT